MPIPDKEGIYPEYYPESVVRVANSSRIDCLTEKMRSKEWFVNVKDALLDNKGDKMLYYRNFDPTHWNMKGAWVGYKEIMSSITSVYDDVKMFTDKDVVITYEKGPGTLESLSSIKWMRDVMQFEDEIVSCIPLEGYRSEQNNEPVIPLVDGQIYFQFSNTHINEGRTILIVGDSYIYSFLLPLLAESFSNVYFTNFVNAEVIFEMQDIIDPDIVLLESVDRAFSHEFLVEQLEKIVE